MENNIFCRNFPGNSYFPGDLGLPNPSKSMNKITFRNLSSQSILSGVFDAGGHSDMTGGALVTADPTLGSLLDSLKSAVGSIASPFEAYLALRGLKTLAVRMGLSCSLPLRTLEEVVLKSEKNT